MNNEEDIRQEAEAAVNAALPSGEDTIDLTEDDIIVGEDGEEDGEEEGSGQSSTHPSLKEVIKENAREDEKPFSSTLALKTILGGDILNTQAIRRQVWLILLITIFAILYVSNRYSCQPRDCKRLGIAQT